MSRKWLIVWSIIILIVIAGIIAVSVTLTPDNTNPAYAVAVDFANAIGEGDQASLQNTISDELEQYAVENCSDGSLISCINNQIPESWGEMIITVFRRAEPEGANAWDVLSVATYEEDQGFSGVCIYTRVERVQNQPETSEGMYEGWRVVKWSGFISCDSPDAGLRQLKASAVNLDATP